MAELRTMARPYAEAAFELAKNENQLAAWDEALQTLAAIVNNPDVHALIGNPHVTAADLATAIVGIVGDGVDENVANLVRLLAEEDRLTLLPGIAALFAERHAAAEDRIDVTVASADELSDAQRQNLQQALEQRLERHVDMTTEVDPELIGGAVIRAGDMVIDGSLRSRIAHLTSTIAR